MAVSRYVFYFKGLNRAVVITDNKSDNIDQTISEAMTVMGSNKVAQFETGNDVLILRPADISAIHICKDVKDRAVDDMLILNEMDIPMNLELVDGSSKDVEKNINKCLENVEHIQKKGRGRPKKEKTEDQHDMLKLIAEKINHIDEHNSDTEEEYINNINEYTTDSEPNLADSENI